MIREYIEYCKKNQGLSSSTLNEYEKNLWQFVEYLKSIDVESWSSVTDYTMGCYVRDLGEKGNKPATIKKKVSVVRCAYAWAVREHRLTSNPAKYTATPKKAAILPKTMKVEDITAAVTDSTADRKTRLAIAIMAETGARTTETRTLTAEQIDREEWSITLKGKGNKERKVYYGAMTHSLLTGVKETGRIFNEEDYAFRHKIWEQLHKHSTAEKTSGHVLRHTLATEMVKRGAKIEDVREILGHSSVQTTERYAHANTAAVRQSYRRFTPYR